QPHDADGDADQQDGPDDDAEQDRQHPDMAGTGARLDPGRLGRLERVGLLVSAEPVLVAVNVGRPATRLLRRSAARRTGTDAAHPRTVPVRIPAAWAQWPP